MGTPSRSSRSTNCNSSRFICPANTASRSASLPISSGTASSSDTSIRAPDGLSSPSGSTTAVTVNEQSATTQATRRLASNEAATIGSIVAIALAHHALAELAKGIFHVQAAKRAGGNKGSTQSVGQRFPVEDRGTGLDAVI